MAAARPLEAIGRPQTLSVGSSAPVDGDSRAAGRPATSPRSPTPDEIRHDARRVLDVFLSRHLQRRTHHQQWLSLRAEAVTDADRVASFVQAAPSPRARKQISLPAIPHSVNAILPHIDAETRGNAQLDERTVTRTDTSEGTVEISRLDSIEDGSGTMVAGGSPSSGESAAGSGYAREPSSSSSAGGDQRPRIKKSVFKRVRERLRQSLRLQRSTDRRPPTDRATLQPRPRDDDDAVALAVRRSASDGAAKRLAASSAPAAGDRVVQLREQKKGRSLIDRILSISGSSGRSRVTTSERNGKLHHARPPTRSQREFLPFRKIFKRSAGRGAADGAGQRPLGLRRLSDLSRAAPPGIEAALQPAHPTQDVVHKAGGGHTYEIGVQSGDGDAPLADELGRLNLSHTAPVDFGATGDCVYAAIAQRLKELGDEYVCGEWEAARLQARELDDCRSAADDSSLTALERDLFRWARVQRDGVGRARRLRSVGRVALQLRPLQLEALSHVSNARDFSQVLLELAEPSHAADHLTQLALVFYWTSAAVKLAGAGSSAAARLADLCVDYVGARFADWLIGRGGWLSVVEDGSSSSELD